ncbi:MAG: TonB-dependent receptor plug domain-containing protein [Bacteroidota bacterium]
MKYYFIFLFILSIDADAQTIPKQSKVQDSLPSVLVQAFSPSTKWKEAAAAVAVINFSDLNSYAPTSLVPAFNKISGVRMEERSPGSYRLSIRGSLLRSPFGVRNTKIYWNDFPLSDATGNTYLNLMDLSQIDAAEIIKGPAGSIYGAGTGGVVLLKSLLPFSDSLSQTVQVGLEMGSFGLKKEQISWKKSTKHFSSELNHAYMYSDGYRDQSAMRRFNLQYQASLNFSQHVINFLGWITDLYYQTPGGITLAQMQVNPKQARQPTPTLPGAIQQKTAIYNKTVFAGLKDQWKIANNTILQTFVTINNTQFENPFITNYEFRNETNLGLGSKLILNSNNSFQWISGFEWLYNHSVITDFGNKKGTPDTLQFNDQAHANQWSIYSQVQKFFWNKLHMSAGLSMNQQLYRYQRVSAPLSNVQYKSTHLVPAPRISILYDVNHAIAAYGILSYGFSPASLAELRPSDGNYYGELAPEKGWNAEVGLKGFLYHQFIQFDLAYYHFQLKDAIVRRNNAAGAEYFINAGSSLQQGIELMVKANVVKNHPGFLTSMSVWGSQSFQPYHFINYQQGNSNYSGNMITGVPRNIIVAGIDFLILKKLQWYSSLNCVSSIPLTDANDAYANAYQLLQIKIDYPIKFKRFQTRLFAGVDNALNQNYSLGNDINAAGKRYYNPAAQRNFFAGIHFTLYK